MPSSSFIKGIDSDTPYLLSFRDFLLRDIQFSAVVIGGLECLISRRRLVCSSCLGVYVWGIGVHMELPNSDAMEGETAFCPASL